MEFSLLIEDGVIADLRFRTRGCEATRRCGETVGRRALGRTVRDALAINAREILEALPDLGTHHRHCVILAVSALYRTIGTYWLTESISPIDPVVDPINLKGKPP